MPRHIRIGIVCLAILSVVGASYYYNLQRRIHELVRPTREAPQPYLATQPVFSEAAPLRKVKLLFPSATQDGLLEPEERDIHVSDLPSAEAKQIMGELITGSRQGRLPALPPKTQLRELFITDEGLAVVDITREARDSHPGGLTQEVTSIYAIVNSLTQNVKGIESVQIVIEGAEAETLAGHIDLTRPFHEDPTLMVTSSTLGGEHDGEGHVSGSAEIPSSLRASTPSTSTAAKTISNGDLHAP
jgi:Sporulation and spore germination